MHTTVIKASIDSLGRVVHKAHDTIDSKLMASTWAKDGVLSTARSPPVSGWDAIVSTLNNLPLLPLNYKKPIIQLLHPA